MAVEHREAPLEQDEQDGQDRLGFWIWGGADADSDLDVLVVKESDQREVERIRDVSRLLRPRPLPVDILVKTPEEIRERLAMGDGLIKEILEKGRVAYERETA